MLGTCGYEKKSDALVTIELNSNKNKVVIKSKLKDMFGYSIEKTVLKTLSEFNISNALVTVNDYGALDFVIKARLRTAIKRATKKGVL